MYGNSTGISGPPQVTQGNPYSNGLQVSGSGSNANFGVNMNPQTGMYQTMVGNTPLPIFTQSQWNNGQGLAGYSTTNQGITQGGTFMPTWTAADTASPANRMLGVGSDTAYNPTSNVPHTSFNAPSMTGGTYYYQRPGTADTTTASYSLDPSTGYYTPSNIQSQNGGESWWQRNGVQTVDQVLPAVAGAYYGLAGDAATGAANSAPSVAGDTPSTMLGSGPDFTAGMPSAAPPTDLGTIVTNGTSLPAETGGPTLGQIGAGAGGVGGIASQLGNSGTSNMSLSTPNSGNSIMFQNQNPPNIYGGTPSDPYGLNNPSVPDPNNPFGYGPSPTTGPTSLGGQVADQTSTNGNSNIFQNIQQVGNGLQQLWQNGGSGLYNSITGNRAQQNIANNLMGMYTNAGNIAQPSVNTVNSTVSNPNQFFQSPFYQSLASLYGNNVNAGKNAAGTNGNPIDYTQKMMGFGAQTYDNYLNSVNNVAQGFLGNQAKYGADYAFGTALGNTANAASTTNGINSILGTPNGSGGGTAGMIGQLGGIAGGLNNLYSGGSNLINSIAGWF